MILIVRFGLPAEFGGIAPICVGANGDQAAGLDQLLGVLPAHLKTGFKVGISPPLFAKCQNTFSGFLFRLLNLLKGLTFGLEVFGPSFACIGIG